MFPVSVYQHPLFLVVVAVAVGLLVGSFLNVVIHRLPNMLLRDWRQQVAEIFTEWAGEKDAPDSVKSLREAAQTLYEQTKKSKSYNLVVPRSACPSCGEKITALENIPLLSWLFLRGRCSHCKNRINPRYPIVEALTGLLSGYVAWRFGFSLQTFGALIFVWAMIALAFIDLDTTYLPDDITQPLLWLGMIFSLAGVFTTLWSSVVGAVFGYMVFWLLAKTWKLIRNVESMGHGDFKLLAAIGSWFGWEMLPQAILISSCIGASVGVGLMIVGRGDLSSKIPFGPYLAIAGIVALLHGAAINQVYWRTTF
jgi:leader peptidase (prepilin peptidase)/N-methyltransferase